MKRILLATDLSARSDRALQRAIALASDFGAALTALHVVDEALPDEILRGLEASASTAMERQVASLPLAGGLRVIKEVVRGDAHADIIRRSIELEADLIVLGIHRHATREMFRGTTAERVVRYGPRPVLVVKDAVTGPYRRALVALDLSPQSLAAAEKTARLLPKGEVYLVHVMHRPFSALLDRRTLTELIHAERQRATAEVQAAADKLAAALGDAAPRFELALREGEVHSVIRRETASIKPDIVALGTHGRVGISHAILGSVAENMLIEAPTDVLVVKT